MLKQPQNTNSLRDTGDNTNHMVFEGEPAVKFRALYVISICARMGLAQMEITYKTKSDWGGLTVLNLLTT